MNNDRIKNEAIEWCKVLSVSILIGIVVSLSFKLMVVEGQSMYPTLKNEDYLIVNKLAYGFDDIPNRGDIIAFESKFKSNKTDKKMKLVKRIIALPGEHIVIKNNKVYINDKILDESYLDEVNTEGNIDFVVPNNEVFIMGDNRQNSFDSRFEEFGTVSIDDIIGKVKTRVYPLDSTLLHFEK